MRIATWNVERLKHKNRLADILSCCSDATADILVLTETDDQIQPEGYQYCFSTLPPANLEPNSYRPSERRVSIFTNYPSKREWPTYDPYTAKCVELETKTGSLIVYGTIMGIYGNRHENYMAELAWQCGDIDRLSSERPLCVCGDYNLSFSDNYYYTKAGRDTVNDCLSRNGLALLTYSATECIDHIALSKVYAGDYEIHISEWNFDKVLSDHKGIVATIEKEINKNEQN